MKQNSQWLSHVRTRSKTAEDTSAPSGSPASFAHPEGQGLVDAAAAHDQVEVGFVHQQAVLDHVTRRPAVEEEDLVARSQAGAVGR